MTHIVPVLPQPALQKWQEGGENKIGEKWKSLIMDSINQKTTYIFGKRL